MPKTAVAYIRKSRVITGQTTISWEVQEAKVRDLAALHDEKDLLILSDWNVSGRKGAAGRPGYARLLGMIEANQVSAVYSYSMSRLSRSVQDLRALVALADKHGTVVRLVSQQIDTSHAMGRMTLTILAAVDEMVADLASEQARDAVEAKRAKGDQIGPVFYGEKDGEDARAVVAAFEEAGTLMGAAKLLNERKVPTRQGRKWGTTTVHDILVRLGARPRQTRKGAKARAPYVLYGLLRCHCGHILTGDRGRRGHDGREDYISYRCHWGRTVPGHGPYSVPEKRVLPWVMAEASRLDLGAPRITITAGEEDPALIARKQALITAHEIQALSDAAFREAMAKLTQVAVDEEIWIEGAIQLLPPVWTAPAEQVNRSLHAMWSEVTLNEAMEPVEALWRHPEWRA